MALLTDIFVVFLRLGCTSFGGPAAHIGYFHKTFVDERKWLSNDSYAAIVALCQFLPGPASSQVGFAIGYQRGGIAGAIAAFVGFTAPSVALLIGLALLTPHLSTLLASGVTQGLKVAAVAIVVHAVWGMQKSLTPDLPRRVLAIGTVALMLIMGGVAGQLWAIAIGALVGAFSLRALPPMQKDLSLKASLPVSSLLLALFVILLVVSLTQSSTLGWGSMLGAFYQSGALVFGGGHVALPLLDAAVVAPGWIDPDTFLTGYGAAQAVPGPMFVLATYLGAMLPAGFGGVGGALLATLAIFLPGFLLLLAVLPWWSALLSQRYLRGAVAGVNAVVVGILASALYSPIALHALLAPIDWLLAVVAIVLMMRFKWSALRVLFVCVATQLSYAFVIGL